jgi:hypothetical protein
MLLVGIFVDYLHDDNAENILVTMKEENVRRKRGSNDINLHIQAHTKIFHSQQE